MNECVCTKEQQTAVKLNHDTAHSHHNYTQFALQSTPIQSN